jgi:hypothetical protein
LRKAATLKKSIAMHARNLAFDLKLNFLLIVIGTTAAVAVFVILCRLVLSARSSEKPGAISVPV